jgi:hypothetical protein
MMNRRRFLATSITGPVALAGLHEPTVAAAPLPDTKVGASPAILAKYSVEDHRRRLENIAVCEKSIHTCLRKHLITNYLPGQCSYNLGEYPCREPWEIDDWDERELDRLKEHGIGLIQLHEEWNDSQRLFGGNKYTALNPAGFRQFLNLAHQRDFKVIVYVSSGFFEKRDPEFQPKWAREQDLVELFYNYARCSPASPSWRAYILKQIVRILDEYAVDGIYNDLGYLRLAGNRSAPTADEVLAFTESNSHDGALADLLALIYEEVKRRGGIVKVHCGAADRPRTTSKVYDYLWVGEDVKSGDGLREAVKDYRPYVVPCLDMSRARIQNEDELYLHAIPYMQFPLLLAGKPFTGERALIPGIQYVPEETDFWTRHCRAIWKYYQTHPDGPFSFGWWDSVPGRPQARMTHANWLKQYAPMAEEGSWAWLEIKDSQLFRHPLPKNIVASVFANREIYLVIANYGRTTMALETAAAYVLSKEPSSKSSVRWQIPARSLVILKRQS